MACDIPAGCLANIVGQISRVFVSKNGTVQKQPKLALQ
jgi:hypothetical protein